MRQRITLCVIAFVLFALSTSTASAAELRQKPPDVLEIETLLSNLGYWITKVDGKADASTRHAIIAFQKVERMKRTGVIGQADLEALRFAQRPTPKHKTGLRHIEIDITHQVLFLVGSSGDIEHILPISTGNERKYFDQGKWQIAHTPRGRFRIQRKLNGIRQASLGALYYPNYFIEGVAIHGSNSVPAFPASHGCVRIPRFADRAFFALATIGMEVFVYD